MLTVVSLTETPKKRHTNNRALRPQYRLTLRGVPGLGLAGVLSTGEAIHTLFNRFRIVFFKKVKLKIISTFGIRLINHSNEFFTCIRDSHKSDIDLFLSRLLFRIRKIQ